jgi:predicted transcriptional regulator
MKKTEAVTAQVAPSLKQALLHLAQAEDRSLSQFIERHLREVVASRASGQNTDREHRIG